MPLTKGTPIEKWIEDFVKSDDPKFVGKSKAERMKMAKGAYFAKQRNESIISFKEWVALDETLEV